MEPIDAYSRNDLAFDQYSTLKSYCGELNHLLSDSSCSVKSNSQLLDADGWIKKEWEQIPHRAKNTLSQWIKMEEPKEAQCCSIYL